MIVQGTTRVFAILGDPVAHSLSPQIHNAALQALGIDGIYVPFHVT
ncbi:MAG: shikimate dehydrogenase, partial [Desulfuromonadales bacterium]|nr:shikimate dehydrogenase [Desulfuromonadales bacterium]